MRFKITKDTMSWDAIRVTLIKFSWIDQFYFSIQSSFPVMHKIDNVDIFVQLQMEINWKWLLVE